MPGSLGRRAVACCLEGLANGWTPRRRHSAGPHPSRERARKLRLRRSSPAPALSARLSLTAFSGPGRYDTSTCVAATVLTVSSSACVGLGVHNYGGSDVARLAWRLCLNHARVPRREVVRV